MAEFTGSWPNNSSYVVDLSDWTNNKDSESMRKRSDVIVKIIDNRNLEQLRSILESGWNVNEVLNLKYGLRHKPLVLLTYVVLNPICGAELLETVQLLLEYGANPNIRHRVLGYENTTLRHRTALHEAVIRGMTDVVKVLLEAGAKCTTSGALQNPLTQALHKVGQPPDLLKLLFKYGADPNDHDGLPENVPLLRAIEICEYEENRTVIVRLLLEHGANPNVTLPVTVGAYGEGTHMHRTAMCEAARRGLADIVKMLLEAGARCTMPDAVENPLVLALQDNKCPSHLIKLLLEHRADPNQHDDQLQKIPLLRAIRNCRYYPNGTVNVQILLEHGANPNVVHRVNVGGYEEEKWVKRTALHEAASMWLVEGVNRSPRAAAAAAYKAGNECGKGLQNEDSPADVVELLLQYGADINSTVIRETPLLHRLSHFTGDHMFPQLHLDLFFLHGVNVNMEDGDHKTALECAVEHNHHSNSNNTRWLIRHGADTALKFTLLKRHFMLYGGSHFPETPLILLQAGMRVSHGARTQLSNMEAAITTWLQDGSLRRGDIQRRIQGMWDLLDAAVVEEFQRRQQFFRKSTFPEYWSQQMADLQEFSDESLHVYPEDTYRSSTSDIRQQYGKILHRIHRVLEFLSQPMSLWWYCRRCVRENLVSLQPSVVKTLPGPARLKCYILCHEI